jgi:Zn-dependent peptidase ImmA (M78 family)
MLIRKRWIRSQVTELLKRYGIVEPPVPVESLAGKLGLQIRKEPAAADISGCLIRKGSTTIIGVNSDQHPNRQRFTVAHEVGHYLLHARVGETSHVDRVPAFSASFRDATSSLAVSLDEIEANFFAAELLMPTCFLVRDIDSAGVDLTDDSGEVLKVWAERYGVRTQALTYRLVNLGMLPHS